MELLNITGRGLGSLRRQGLSLALEMGFREGKGKKRKRKDDEGGKKGKGKKKGKRGKGKKEPIRQEKVKGRGEKQ